jgi:hypothetical protein
MNGCRMGTLRDFKSRFDCFLYIFTCLVNGINIKISSFENKIEVGLCFQLI